MGLFMQRPEEPSEWAGLPSEPIRPKSGAELLRDEPPPVDPLGDLLGGGTTSSVSIPVALPDADSGAAADAPEEVEPGTI